MYISQQYAGIPGHLNAVSLPAAKRGSLALRYDRYVGLAYIFSRFPAHNFECPSVAPCRHHLRRIRLVSRPTGCQVRPVLWDLPAPLPRLQYCVLSRRLVHQIRHPSMPAWFDLARIVFFLLVVYPPRSHCGTSAMSQQPESQQTYVATVEGEQYEAVLAQGSRSICCRICRLRCRCQLWCRPCIAFDGHIP